MRVSTHQQRSAHSPQGIIWVQPNTLSCALSQNNCPFLHWRDSNTWWLAGCPEIDHFIIKWASQGSNCSGKKVNRRENESASYCYKYVFTAMTKNGRDFFKVQIPRYFTAENVKPLSCCYNNWPHYDTFHDSFSVVMWSALQILNKFELLLICFPACSIIGSEGSVRFVGCERTLWVIPGYKCFQTFIHALCFLVKLL